MTNETAHIINWVAFIFCGAIAVFDYHVGSYLAGFVAAFCSGMNLAILIVRWTEIV